MRVSAALKPAIATIVAAAPKTQTALRGLVADNARALNAAGVKVTNDSLFPIAHAAAVAAAVKDRRNFLGGIHFRRTTVAAARQVLDGIPMEDALGTANSADDYKGGSLENLGVVTSIGSIPLPRVIKAAHVKAAMTVLRRDVKDQKAFFKKLAKEAKGEIVHGAYDAISKIGEIEASEVLALADAALPDAGRSSSGNWSYYTAVDLIAFDATDQKLIVKVFESEWNSRKNRGTKKTDIYSVDFSQNHGTPRKFWEGNGRLLNSMRKAMEKGNSAFSCL